jgi:hypothetical protein
MNPKIQQKSVAAFSLLELLVSMTILSTLMLMLFGFFDQATRAWQNSEKKVDAFREARAALFFLKRDLEGLWMDETIPLFHFDDPALLGNLIRPAPTLDTPAEHGDALFFLSAQSAEAQDSAKGKSVFCAVGYYPVFDRDPQALSIQRSSYRLLRYFKSSDETWQSGAKGCLPFLISVAAGSPDYLSLFVPPIATTTGDEVIARNVINFKVRPLDADYVELAKAGTGLILEKPAFFEISLTALNLETAQNLATQSDWHKSAPNYNNSNLFQQNAQEFKLRVAVPK